MDSRWIQSNANEKLISNNGVVISTGAAGANPAQSGITNGLNLGGRYTPSSVILNPGQAGGASGGGMSASVGSGIGGGSGMMAGHGGASQGVGPITDRDSMRLQVMSGSSIGNRGRPRGRRPLRGQFPVVPIDMVRQLGIEQQVILQPPVPVAMRNKATMCRPNSVTKKVQCSSTAAATQTTDAVGTDNQLMNAQSDNVANGVGSATNTIKSEIEKSLEFEKMAEDRISTKKKKVILKPIYVPIPVPIYVPVPIPIPSGSTVMALEGDAQSITPSVSTERVGSNDKNAQQNLQTNVAGDEEADNEMEEEDDGPAATPAVEQSETSESGNLKRKIGEGEEEKEEYDADDQKNTEMEVENQKDSGASKRQKVSSTSNADSTPAATSAAVATATQSATQTANNSNAAAKSASSDASSNEAINLYNEERYHIKCALCINAWRHWLKEKLAAASGNEEQMEELRNADLLSRTPTELNRLLAQFVLEVRKPNNEAYGADSVFYLCLGIQFYLITRRHGNNQSAGVTKSSLPSSSSPSSQFINIFADPELTDFQANLDTVVKTFEPRVNQEGLLICRIEEEHLWETRQLGTHSPEVLIFSLLYFCTKHLLHDTAGNHLQLRFRDFHVEQQQQNQLCLIYKHEAAGEQASSNSQQQVEILPGLSQQNRADPNPSPAHIFSCYLQKCKEIPKFDMIKSGLYLKWIPQNQNVSKKTSAKSANIWFETIEADPEQLQRMINRIKTIKEIQEGLLHSNMNI